MDSTTAERLVQLNREFYERFGAEFSATRQRVQPGVMRILQTLTGNESILDLGCGNGELARTLNSRGHRSSYLGVDFSLPLLRDASAFPKGFAAAFVETDLTKLSMSQNTDFQLLTFDLVTCFATLHHIPSNTLRFQMIEFIRMHLAPDGWFIHSNWQFLNSTKLRARIQPWERIGLHTSDVDEGDYLLDWRRGGEGLRYAHQFTEEELADMAAQTGFVIVQSFYSDGVGGRLGLYQVWKTREKQQGESTC